MKKPALLALTFLLASPPAHADLWGDIGKGLSNLGDAAANVGTLGEVGRRRDRERAERAAAEMNQRRAEAEARKAQELNNLSVRQRDFEAAASDLTFINLTLNSVSLQFSEITAYLKKNVTKRTWLTNTIRRFKGVSEQDQAFTKEVLSILDSATAVETTDNAVTDLARQKESVLRAKEAIDRLRATAQSHDLEMNGMLAQVFASLEVEEAKAAFDKIKLAGQGLEKLKAYVEQRSKDNAAQSANIKAQIDAINGTPLPPPAAPLPPEAAPSPEPLGLQRQRDMTENCHMLCI